MTVESKTLLLVEDEALIAMEEVRQLEKEGYAVVHAFSAAEAIDIVKRKGAAIDLILMDIDLGRGMDGTGAAREILKDHDIPVVFLSSHAEKEIVEKTETITSYGYVVKNTGITVLAASIKMAFRLFEAHRGIRAKSMEVEAVNGELCASIEEMEAANEELTRSRGVIMESEERYRFLFDNMLNGFALHDIILDGKGNPVDYRFLAVNPAFEALTGLNAGDITGKTVREIIPAVESYWIEKYGKVALTGVPDTFENYLRDFDRWYSVTAFSPRKGQFAVIFENVTERRRAEESLKNRNALIASISNNLPSTMIYQIVRDSDGTRHFTYVSETVRLFYGCSPDEAMADPGRIYGRVAEGDRDRIIREEEAANTALAEFRSEARIINPDGGVRWSRFISTPETLADGVTRWDGIEIDITERKRMEEGLRESEERFRRIFEDGPIGVAISGADFHFRTVNCAFCNILGYSEAELGSITFREITHPAHLNADTGKVAALISGEISIYRTDKRYIRKDGTVIWANLTLSPVRDEHGKLLHLIVLIEDITERKKAEEALSLSEDRFRRMVDSVTDYIYTVTVRDGRPVATSHGPACENVTGYSPGNYESDPGLWYRMIHEDDRALVELQAAGMLSGEGSGTIEHRIIHKNGSTRWVKNTPVLLRDGQGRPAGYDGLIVDITERKKAEEELIRSAREKDILMKELQHRVKNNLGVIKGLLSLEMQNLADGHSRGVFQDAMDRIQSMSAIYEQLNASSSLDRVDLKKYVGDIARRLFETYMLDSAGITLSMKLDDAVLDVKRTVPLGLIMNELITNALKYAYPVGSGGELRVNLVNAGGDITLEVSDDGTGLPGDVRAGKSPGMGIRLVEMLADQIGAALVLEGDGGTTARITFPADGGG